MKENIITHMERLKRHAELNFHNFFDMPKSVPLHNSLKDLEFLGRDQKEFKLLFDGRLPEIKIDALFELEDPEIQRKIKRNSLL